MSCSPLRRPSSKLSLRPRSREVRRGTSVEELIGYESGRRGGGGLAIPENENVLDRFGGCEVGGLVLDDDITEGTVDGVVLYPLLLVTMLKDVSTEVPDERDTLPIDSGLETVMMRLGLAAEIDLRLNPGSLREIRRGRLRSSMMLGEEGPPGVLGDDAS